MASKPGKMNVYEIVTDKILDALDKGVVPWQKPWNSRGQGRHANLVSKKAYRGINPLLLDMAAMSGQYSSPWWVSYKQAQSLGGQVRKGEKGTLITFWKVVGKDENKKDDKAYRILRYYLVWNTDQCDGLEGKIPVVDTPADFSPVDEAQAILDGMPNPPGVIFGGDRACYAPSSDCVQLPYPEDFVRNNEFYKTAFHEFAHSTGHASRLKRDGIVKLDSFGSDQYSEEELIAEITAAFLTAEAGILDDESVENSAAYIASWRRKLSNDPKLIVKAAGAAQKAADCVLGITWDKPKVEDNSEELVAA
jgi:antirestriction protein ArdC